MSVMSDLIVKFYPSNDDFVLEIPYMTKFANSIFEKYITLDENGMDMLLEPDDNEMNIKFNDAIELFLETVEQNNTFNKVMKSKDYVTIRFWLDGNEVKAWTYLPNDNYWEQG